MISTSLYLLQHKDSAGLCFCLDSVLKILILLEFRDLLFKVAILFSVASLFKNYDLDREQGLMLNCRLIKQ